MAIILSFEDRHGNLSEYFAISHKQWTKVFANANQSIDKTKVSELELFVWKNKQAREEGKLPITTIKFTDIDITDKTDAELYAIIKTKKVKIVGDITLDFSQAQDD